MSRAPCGYTIVGGYHGRCDVCGTMVSTNARGRAAHERGKIHQAALIKAERIEHDRRLKEAQQHLARLERERLDRTVEFRAWRAERAHVGPPS